MVSVTLSVRRTIVAALLTSLMPVLPAHPAPQEAGASRPVVIDTSGLLDSAHHWWDITDDDHVITPLPGQRKYAAYAITDIADNMLRYQKANGGWPKNYDMQAILTDGQKASLAKAGHATNTTIDNGATHSQIAYLAQAFAATHDTRYSAAVLRGIDYLLAAQYGNGGWPQFFPEARGYARYITFNDGAMIGVMEVFHSIVRNDAAYAFVDPVRRAKVKAAFANGLECILQCQIREHDTLSVWGQQHDNVTLKPQSARTFEPASICNLESADIVEFLMSIDHPSKAVIRSVQAAVHWFEATRLYGIRVATIPAPTVHYQYHTATTDKIVVADSTAQPIWPRLTELRTHRPLFSSRNWKIVYSLADVDRERRTGYGWYTYLPQHILDAYPDWARRNSPAGNKHGK